jgi:hypothetical protein
MVMEKQASKNRLQSIVFEPDERPGGWVRLQHQAKKKKSDRMS